MKRILIMAVLATVLVAVPVFGEDQPTAQRTNEKTRIASTTTAIPLSGQFRRRRHRRRYVARRYDVLIDGRT